VAHARRRHDGDEEDKETLSEALHLIIKQSNAKLERLTQVT